MILDSSELKVFACGIFRLDENVGKFSKWVENTVGKGAISTFPKVFSKDLNCRHVKTRTCLEKGLDPTNLPFDWSVFLNPSTFQQRFLFEQTFKHNTFPPRCPWLLFMHHYHSVKGIKVHLSLPLPIFFRHPGARNPSMGLRAFSLMLR